MTTDAKKNLSPDTLPPIVNVSLASFLELDGIPIEGLILTGDGDPVGKVKIGFIAPNTEKAVSAIARFYANASVPIQDYLRAEVHCRDIMFSLVRAAKYDRHVPGRTHSAK